MHSGGNNGNINRNLKWYEKVWKHKINILHTLKKTNLTVEKRLSVLYDLIILKQYTYRGVTRGEGGSADADEPPPPLYSLCAPLT